jgi:DNA invertase Pin-like site-specific DNA recombinase
LEQHRSRIPFFLPQLRISRNYIDPRAPAMVASAKARGVKLGRQPKLTERQKREAIRRRDRDGEPLCEIACSYKSRTARFHA